MKRITMLLPTFVVVLIVGCQGDEAQATASAVPVVEPTATAVPAVEPTVEVLAASPPTAETAELDALTENSRQWVSFTDPLQQFDVDMPESYLLTFNDDGCPPDSRSDQFVEYPGFAARYFFEDAQLYIDLFADGGTMLFAPEGEAEMAEAAAREASGLPPAEIANDEGRPAVVTGDLSYTSYAVPTHFVEPVVELMDVSREVQGEFGERVPHTGQILGTLTSPLAPSPASYRVDVSILPGGESVDLDNDGQEDAGVQIYALVLGTNMVGDSYLEQVEQGGYGSFLADPQTGAIREGTFLVYAPDDAQGFPSRAGEDGLLFTADDPAVALPAGYTLVTLSLDGEVSFDRAREAKMDTLEPAAAASPDFSDQGILESYNSLIDLLSVRYSYTELRNLDWEQIRQEYLPRVQAADEADDMTAYYLALFDLVMSIRDSHVQVNATDPQIRVAPYAKLGDKYNGSLGAQVVELSDGRFVVVCVDPEGPGAQAGWEFGTEIVSVDGVSMGERLDTLPVVAAVSLHR